MSTNPPLLRPLALVTGADTAIGAALSDELASRGFDQLLAGEDGDGLFERRKRLQSEHGVQATLFQGDLSREPMRKDLAILIADAELKPDLLVHAAPTAAGLADDGRAARNRRLDLAERATLDLVELVLPGFRIENNGYLLLLADESGLAPDPDRPADCAAQHWIVGYGRSLAAAWKGGGFSATVACYRPGEVPASLARRALKALFARKPLLRPAGLAGAIGGRRRP